MSFISAPSTACTVTVLEERASPRWIDDAARRGDRAGRRIEAAVKAIKVALHTRRGAVRGRSSTVIVQPVAVLRRNDDRRGREADVIFFAVDRRRRDVAVNARGADRKARTAAFLVFTADAQEIDAALSLIPAGARRITAAVPRRTADRRSRDAATLREAEETPELSAPARQGSASITGTPSASPSSPGAGRRPREGSRC